MNTTGCAELMRCLAADERDRASNARHDRSGTATDAHGHCTLLESGLQKWIVEHIEHLQRLRGYSGEDHKSECYKREGGVSPGLLRHPETSRTCMHHILCARPVESGDNDELTPDVSWTSGHAVVHGTTDRTFS